MASADARNILPDLDRVDFLRSPLYPLDDELAMAVYEALWRYLPIRFAAIHNIEIFCLDAVVRLSGHVSCDLHRKQAGLRAAAAPGVLDVINVLVSDEDLIDAVALALLPYPPLQPSRVRVGARLGTVVLEGELDTEADIHLATRAAAEVPGVAAVQSRLRVRSPGPHHQPPPAVGLLAIVPAQPRPHWRYPPETVRVKLPLG